MDWKIIDENGEFLMEANCQYDCCDLAVAFYSASKIEVDFSAQEAKIVEREEN